MNCKKNNEIKLIFLKNRIINFCLKKYVLTEDFKTKLLYVNSNKKKE